MGPNGSTNLIVKLFQHATKDAFEQAKKKKMDSSFPSVYGVSLTIDRIELTAGNALPLKSFAASKLLFRNFSFPYFFFEKLSSNALRALKKLKFKVELSKKTEAM